MASRNRVVIGIGGLALGFGGGILVGTQPQLLGHAAGQRSASADMVECYGRDAELRVRWEDESLGSELDGCDFITVDRRGHGVTDLGCADEYFPFITDLREQCLGSEVDTDIDLDCVEDFFDGFTYPISLPD